MTDEDFIREAIKIGKAAEDAAAGALPLGAVLVKDGKIIARSQSQPWQQRDTTNHAEIDCIRAAAKQAGLKDLTGCTLYGVIEPCSMCFGACLWSGVDRVVFGAYSTDIAANPYEYDRYSVKELAETGHTFDGRRIQVTGGVLREECKNLMKDYKGWVKQV
jgi:tRNA(Arg) A34 adenosine deaminase TadA